jgi:hypothetical protein
MPYVHVAVYKYIIQKSRICYVFIIRPLKKNSITRRIRLQSRQITVLEKGPCALILQFLTGCVLYALAYRPQIW